MTTLCNLIKGIVNENVNELIQKRAMDVKIEDSQLSSAKLVLTYCECYDDECDLGIDIDLFCNEFFCSVQCDLTGEVSSKTSDKDFTVYTESLRWYDVTLNR